MHHAVPPLELRLKAYDEFSKIRVVNDRKDVVDTISSRFGVNKTTVYSWFRGTTPAGRRAGRVSKIPELLYVLGALLGDGCIYHGRNNFQVWIVGERDFTAKFAEKLSSCLGRKVHNYKYGSKNAWFVHVDNAELFLLFRAVRKNHSLIPELVQAFGEERGWLEFVSGFFDAEGCVKIIGGKERRTPKVCLDICNTDIEILTLVSDVLKRNLGIESRFSTQPAAAPRKACHHLRIYRKEGIAKFLRLMPTTKLKKERRHLVVSWLEKRGRGGPTLRLSPA